MNQKMMVFMGMGFELAGLAWGAAYVGQLIDAHFKWNMLATLTLILACLGVWFYHIIFLLKKMENDEEP